MNKIPPRNSFWSDKTGRKEHLAWVNGKEKFHPRDQYSIQLQCIGSCCNSMIQITEKIVKSSMLNTNSTNPGRRVFITRSMELVSVSGDENKNEAFRQSNQNRLTKVCRLFSWVGVWSYPERSRDFPFRWMIQLFESSKAKIANEKITRISLHNSLQDTFDILWSKNSLGRWKYAHFRLMSFRINIAWKHRKF